MLSRLFLGSQKKSNPFKVENRAEEKKSNPFKVENRAEEKEEV